MAESPSPAPMGRATPANTNTVPLVQLYRGPTSAAAASASPSPSAPALSRSGGRQAPLPQSHSSPIRHHANHHQQQQPSPSHPRSSPNRINNPADNGNSSPRHNNNNNSNKNPSRQGSSSGRSRNLNRSGGGGGSNNSTPTPTTNRSGSAGSGSAGRGPGRESSNRTSTATRARTPVHPSTSQQQPQQQQHPHESVLLDHRRAIERGDLFSPQVRQLRQEIINQHVTSILANPHQGLASDLEHLWRHGMYCVVDTYRKQARVAAKAGSTRDSTKESTHKYQPHLFDSFVSQSMGILHHLISQLTARYGLPPAIFDLHHLASPQAAPVALLATAPSLSADTSTAAALLIFRSLIYLGDLARYRDQSSSSSTPSPSLPTTHAESVMYYKRAHTIVPDNGNPHNQLAIVSLTLGKYVAALDLYLRALLARVPFPTARGNLALAAMAVVKQAAGDAVEADDGCLAVKPLAKMLLGRSRDVETGEGEADAWAQRVVAGGAGKTLSTLVLGLLGVQEIGVVARAEGKVAADEARRKREVGKQVANVYLSALVAAMAEMALPAVSLAGGGEKVVDRVLPALRMALIWTMPDSELADALPQPVVDLMHAIERAPLVTSMLGIGTDTASTVANMLATLPPVALPEDLDELVGLVPFAAHVAAVLPALDGSHTAAAPLGHMGFRSMDAIVELQAKVAAAKGLQADVVRAGRMMAVWQAVAAKVGKVTGPTNSAASVVRENASGSRHVSPQRSSPTGSLATSVVQDPPSPPPPTSALAAAPSDARKASVGSATASTSSVQLLQAPNPQQHQQQRRGSGASNRRYERGNRGGRGAAAQRGGTGHNASPRHTPARLGSPGLYYGPPLDPLAYAAMVMPPPHAEHDVGPRDFLDEDDDEFDPTPRQDRLPSAMPALVAVAAAAASTSKSPTTNTRASSNNQPATTSTSPARDHRQQHDWDSLDDEFDPTLPAISASLRALALDAEDERAAGTSPGRSTDDVSGSYLSTSFNGSASAFGASPWGPTSPAAAVGSGWPMSPPPPANSAYVTRSPHESFAEAGMPPRSTAPTATATYSSTSANPWANQAPFQQQSQYSAPPTAAALLSLNAAADSNFNLHASPLPTPFADAKPGTSSTSSTSSSRRPSLLPPPGPYADQLWSTPTSPVPNAQAYAPQQAPPVPGPPPGFAGFTGIPPPAGGAWGPGPAAFQQGGQFADNPYLAAAGYGPSGMAEMHEQQGQQVQHFGYSQLVHMIHMGNGGAGATRSG